jgi:ADP-ribose pyrophosphatase YjhB (NUDIX family)
MAHQNKAPIPEEAQHQTFEVGVKALIFREERLLLLRRRDQHGWEMPGGRINIGETIEQTLMRELAEELPGGWNFVVRGIVHAQRTDFILPNGNGLMLLFLDVASQLPQVVDVSDEHEDSAWLTRTEFDAMDLPPQFRAAGIHAFENHAKPIQSWEDLLP